MGLMENNNMKDFNIAEILKYAPKGLKLYSPLLGEVRLEKVSDHDDTIVVTTKYKSERVFFEDGKYDSNGECLLFPSVNHRCWQHWQNTLFLESIGSVCVVDNIMGNKFILDHNGTFFSDGTGSQYSTLIELDSGNYLLNSRYATPEEAKEFFDELENNGYEWDGKKVVKKNTIPLPKFKVGDVIKHTPTGEIAIIKHVCSDYYVLEKGTSLYFEAQDMWGLVASKVNLSLENKVSILMDEINSIKQDIESLKVSRNQARMRIDSLENWVIENGNPDILEKIDTLEKNVKALTNRLDAIAASLIGITPPLTKDPILYPDKVTCANVFKTSDKAGDNVTLEEMKS